VAFPRIVPNVEKGRALVMDDDEGIRMIAELMLKEIGYEVQLSRNGDEAVMHFSREMDDGRPFDIVILDLKVPEGMGGEEAVKRLRELDPGVKAIASSGLANTPVMREFKKYGFNGVLPKPYNLKDLVDILSGVLSGPSEIDTLSGTGAQLTPNLNQTIS
jgi:two-component system cell cycle sensor histidine kinase/response regulator CckA